MKRFVVLAGILGFTLFGVLVAYAGAGDVARAASMAGWATLTVILIRAIIIVGAGISWHLLFPVGQRLQAHVAVGLRFIREGVNGLLPVAQVGGDVVGARLATFWRMDGAMAGATTIADVALQAATQALFTLLGIGLLLWLGSDEALAAYAAWGVAVAVVLIGAFFAVQARLGSRVFGAVLRRFGVEGPVLALVDSLWAALATVYAAPGRIARSALLHLVVWVVGALEVYVALHAMGYPVSIAEAIVIESLAQAVRGAAFAVPGGIGVQEGGLIALCAIFGVPAGTALALSLVKRAADLALGLPALLAWQVIEGRHAFRAVPVTEPGS